MNQIWFNPPTIVSKELQNYDSSVLRDYEDGEVADVFESVLERFFFICSLETNYQSISFYLAQHPTNLQPICMIVKSPNELVVGATKGRLTIEIKNVEEISGTGEYVFWRGLNNFDLGVTIYSYYTFLMLSAEIKNFEYFLCKEFNESLISRFEPVLPVVVLNDERVYMDDFSPASRLNECQYLLDEDSIWNQVESIEMLEVLHGIDFIEVQDTLKYEFTCSGRFFNEHYLSFESKSKEGFAVVHVSDETISVDIVMNTRGGKYDFKLLVDDFTIDFSTMMLAYKAYNIDKDNKFTVCEFLKDSECFEYIRFLRMTTY